MIHEAWLLCWEALTVFKERNRKMSNAFYWVVAKGLKKCKKSDWMAFKS